MGMSGQVRHLDARNEVMHAYADHGKVQKAFSIQSGYTLKEGLQLMADWAKTAGSKESDKFKGIEITEKLPAIWQED